VWKQEIISQVVIPGFTGCMADGKIHKVSSRIFSPDVGSPAYSDVIGAEMTNYLHPLSSILLYLFHAALTFPATYPDNQKKV
jgi:hypothetical protein